MVTALRLNTLRLFAIILFLSAATLIISKVSAQEASSAPIESGSATTPRERLLQKAQVQKQKIAETQATPAAKMM